MSQEHRYGGQAVIEGVLVRGQRQAAIACRRPNGEIVLRAEPLSGAMAGQVGGIPFVRGLVLLGETMSLGVRSLHFSSRVAENRDTEVTPDRQALALAISISLAFSAAIFFAMPLAVTNWLRPLLGHETTLVVEGGLRLAVLAGYVWGVGFIPNIRRLFAYHGAEHMVVNAYEAGMPLTVDQVKRFSVIHKRCGTAFAFIVMVLSMGAFAMVGEQPLVEGVIARCVMVPLIATSAYELLRLSAAHAGHHAVGLLAWPSLIMQKLTTRPPTDEQIETAIAAMQYAVELDTIAALEAHAERGGELAPVTVEI